MSLARSSAGALIASPDGSVDWGSGPAIRLGSADPDTCCFYLPDFFLTDSQPWWRFETNGKSSRADLAEIFSRTEFAPAVPLVWDEPCRAAFARAFTAVQERIGDGRLEKAVPVAFERSRERLSIEERAGALSRAFRAPATLLPYAAWNDSEGILGATPEVLFELSASGDLSTMALAGTRPRSEAPSLLWEDAKERREHAIVVEDLLRALTALGEVEAGETGMLELPTLRHLRTPLRARLREGVGFEEIAAALHPTAALGVSPRSGDWRWLSEQAQVGERRRFGAPFGVKRPDGSALCLVAIRNVQWDPTGRAIGSGCGVVRESVLAREWEELRLKRASVKELLHL